MNFFTTKMVEDGNSLKKRFGAIISGNKKMTAGVAVMVICIGAALVVGAGAVMSAVNLPEDNKIADTQAKSELTYSEKAEIMLQLKGEAEEIDKPAVKADGASADVPEITIAVPCEGEAFSAYFNEERGHFGADIVAEQGTAVYAATEGIVSETGFDFEKGNYAVIVTADGTVQTAYHHLSEIVAEKGSTVKCGELIGKVGKTGMATGPHLHFEIQVNGVYYDPEIFLNEVGFGEYRNLKIDL